MVGAIKHELVSELATDWSSLPFSLSSKVLIRIEISLCELFVFVTLVV